MDPEFFKKMDWDMLRKQKAEILKAIDDGWLSDNANGIVYLIDQIQDYAVDSLGYAHDIVFQ